MFYTTPLDPDNSYSAEDIISSAITTFGAEHQLNILAEECAEVIQRISHLRRKRCSLSDLASELADLEITLSQAKLIVTPELVTHHYQAKLQRLLHRITLHQQKQEHQNA